MMISGAAHVGGVPGEGPPHFTAPDFLIAYVDGLA